MEIPEHITRAESQAAFRVDVQPGDKTWYRFILTDGSNEVGTKNGDGRRAVTIVAGPDGPRFDAYPYWHESILDALREYEGLDAETIMRGYHEGHPRWHYLGYICEHSNCNPWTALAALRAAGFVLGWGHEKGPWAFLGLGE